MENGSYLKLKNVQLGYAFSTNLLQQVKIKSARIFVMANNLFTITKYTGLDFLPKALSNSMHVVNSAYNGDQAWNEMANTNLTVGNSHSGDAWQTLYTGVKNCNVLLAGVNFYNTKYAKAGDAQSVNYIIGQAYFLRAYYYFQLECLFGESCITTSGGGDKMGLPIFDTVPPNLDSTQKARSSVREVWDFIENDLKQSATCLKARFGPVTT